MASIQLPPGYPTCGVVYYVDSEYIIKQRRDQLLCDIEKLSAVRITRGVMREIGADRATSLRCLNNAYIDVDERSISSLGCRFAICFGFLRRCARGLPAPLWSSPEYTTARNRSEAAGAVQRVKQAIWRRSEHVDQERVNASLAKMSPNRSREELRTLHQSFDRQTDKAQNKYYIRERAIENPSGRQSWTDEDLFAFASTESWVRGCISVIISADKDYVCIGKQCADNLIAQLLSHGARGDLEEDRIIERFQEECRKFFDHNLARTEGRPGGSFRPDLDRMSQFERTLWECTLGLKRDEIKYPAGDVVVLPELSTGGNVKYRTMSFPSSWLREIETVRTSSLSRP